MSDHDHHDDGVSRRRVLECMTWAGTGVLWTITGGVPRSLGLVDRRRPPSRRPDLPADQRQPCRLRQAGQSQRARHAEGSHQQDQRAADEALVHDPHRRHHPSVEARRSSTTPTSIISQAKLDVHYVPGEHDIIDEEVKLYASATAAAPRATAGIRFDAGGVHFVGLVNVANLKAGGLGSLGDEQLEWLEDDLKGRSEIDAGRAVRPYPAVDGLSAMGLGHGGRRPRAGHTSSASARSPC